MLKYFLFVLIPTISLGLSVDKLDKLIEDRVQNTELDGDNVDFPPSLVDDLEETKEANTEDDNKEGIKETNEIVNKEIAASTSKLVDFVKQYFANQRTPTEKIWSFGNTNSNSWNFWKDFVAPHSSSMSSLNSLNNLKYLGHFGHFNNFDNGNWWNSNWNTNSKQDDGPSEEESMLTIYHKMTVDNHTREGITKVPSADLMPFMRTVWNSLSRDSHMALGIGAFLPFLGIILPFVIFATVIPLIFLIMISVFGMMSGILVLMPLMLTGLLGSENTFPLEKMIEEMFLDEFVGSDNVNKIFEAIEKVDTIETEDDEDENTSDSQEEQQIPRFLSF